MGVRAASLTTLTLDGVRVPESAVLGATDGTTYAECVRLSRLAWCALAVGVGQAVLDYVTPYVKEREAFGEPIAHRQSVAFMVADIAIELQAMRLLTWKAASRAAAGKDFAREVALARTLCADKGMRIGLDGVQLLGGHGFVKEHPVERWYRDLRADLGHGRRGAGLMIISRRPEEAAAAARPGAPGRDEHAAADQPHLRPRRARLPQGARPARRDDRRPLGVRARARAPAPPA